MVELTDSTLDVGDSAKFNSALHWSRGGAPAGAVEAAGAARAPGRPIRIRRCAPDMQVDMGTSKLVISYFTTNSAKWGHAQ
jgi:hypothetical protein